MNLQDTETITQGPEAGGYDLQERSYYKALQRAINDGSGWKFEGAFGRAMMSAIQAGKCLLGRDPAEDYWGSYIPSRYQVEAGTAGSVGYVEEHSGPDWAEWISNID